MGVDGDGVAAVVMVEGLRVGNAMLCPQGVMGDAVAPKRRMVLATASGGGDGMRGGRRAWRGGGR